MKKKPIETKYVINGDFAKTTLESFVDAASGRITINIQDEIINKAVKRYIAIMETQEEMIRNALIKLGWKPPAVKCEDCSFAELRKWLGEVLLTHSACRHPLAKDSIGCYTCHGFRQEGKPCGPDGILFKPRRKDDHENPS